MNDLQRRRDAEDLASRRNDGYAEQLLRDRLAEPRVPVVLKVGGSIGNSMPPGTEWRVVRVTSYVPGGSADVEWTTVEFHPIERGPAR